jgi:hypothetical protein
MYNDFILVGPKSDPAGIKGSKNIVAALKVIKDKAFRSPRAAIGPAHTWLSSRIAPRRSLRLTVWRGPGA